MFKKRTTQWTMNKGSNVEPTDNILTQNKASAGSPSAGIDNHRQYASDQIAVESIKKKKSLFFLFCHPRMMTTVPIATAVIPLIRPEKLSANCNGCIHQL
jgi:hypothetical protein